MHYRSIADMTRLIAHNLNRVPSDVDLIVGIPRSGILPAITIALLLNLRYTDCDSFVAGRLSGAGSTKRHKGLVDSMDEVRHVLVVDDSLNRGDAMREVRERLSGFAGAVRFTFCAIYVVPDATDEVDLLFEALPLPRVFEWNFMHHVYLSHACVDIDGVLCLDPIAEENDDGPRYAEFLGAALPLYRPTRPIGCLVTSRLEKYRAHTEAWLAEHGIVYDRLVMLDVPTAEERRRLGLHGKFKGEVYRDSKAMLFIESEHSQAIEIARISGKPVLSIEAQQIVGPSQWSGVAAYQKVRNFGLNAKMSRSPLVNRQSLKRKLRRVLPEPLWNTAKRMVTQMRA